MNQKLLWGLLLGIVAFIILMAVYTYTRPSAPLKEESSDILFSNLHTDQARYDPKHQVTFSIKNHIKPDHVTITYYHLNDLIKKQHLTVDEPGEHIWSWKPPEDDYRGYLIEVTMKKDDRIQSETIAVDVSSDWRKFPRYGFLSRFDDSAAVNGQSVIDDLNRYHINGLQFYDWHYEHQEPLKMDNSSPASHWEDVATRHISFDAVQQYIEWAHETNMKAMSYNLLYGSFENRDLPREWQLFKDPDQQQADQHPLPDDWKSNVNVMNPTNPWWQEHLINQQKQVYAHLPFDGWHIDQLGDRGEVYNEWGDRINVAESFQPFLQEIKEQMPDKEMVLNAVNQYGQSSIAEASPSFLYTEVWDEYKTYNDLKRILDENAALSKTDQSSVLAAYMNYDRSDQPGNLNEAGILLTDAVIFASGGAHLELGEHMLSKEYFPHNNLQMSAGLKKKMMAYYDFLTAYENVLRDNISESSLSIDANQPIPLSVGEAKKDHIWVLPKEKGNRQMIHFINLLDAETIEWRDTNATQPVPELRTNLTFTIEEDRRVKEIWMASPDYHSGKPVAVPFEQSESQTTFTLPSLTYWDMLVVEYEE
ncbi:dextranase [Bacillus ectoiniformans]|uniref:glycoside hydrolase family 66 protein n=1 Tax=Bacillus ectoiniformans TaxID=1494429 RepID=UPI00195A8201|nr:glycoside hydrolase family 66 protein [Bacillus ectoiniformans]MBM7649482.1 dextranase [Bacillus ectoiniformans]